MDIIFIIATYADIRSIGKELNQKGTIYDLTIFGGGGLAGRGARLVRYSVCVCMCVCVFVCVLVGGWVLVDVLVLVLILVCVDMLLVVALNKTYSLQSSTLQPSLLSLLIILLIVLV
jgi:Flp pilus assembly protein TadB